MVYKEFLNSARKHLRTCEVIRDSLMSLDDTNPDNDLLVKALTLNLYYISGYIIECSIKYGIYVCIGYDQSVCVKQLDQSGISYGRQIKQHRFDKYEDILKSRHGGIILVDNKYGIPQPVKNLYNNWDAHVRYCCDDIPQEFKHCDNKDHVLTFFRYAKMVFQSIESNLR